MKTYKVWLHIEEYGEGNDCYEDARLPECIGTFDLIEDAIDCFDIICAEHESE